jgi:hypothetical protein
MSGAPGGFRDVDAGSAPTPVSGSIAGCPTQRGFRCVGRWEASPLSHSDIRSTNSELLPLKPTQGLSGPPAPHV